MSSYHSIPLSTFFVLKFLIKNITHSYLLLSCFADEDGHDLLSLEAACIK